jgi:hypothetical protein
MSRRRKRPPSFLEMILIFIGAIILIGFAVIVIMLTIGAIAMVGHWLEVHL